MKFHILSVVLLVFALTMSRCASVAPTPTLVTWMDTLHFYKAGYIIVFYVGSDETILGLLEPQFAGR
jgi:hypothetical protein